MYRVLYTVEIEQNTIVVDTEINLVVYFNSAHVFALLPTHSHLNMYFLLDTRFDRLCGVVILLLCECS